MPGLQETLARLARQAKAASKAGAVRGGRMVEVQAFGSDPGALRMLMHRPDALPDGAPLVVVLHGCAQTAEEYAQGAGWLDLADRYGFAVLCPEQRSENNPNRCFNWFQPEDARRGGGEVESIRQMVERAIADNGLDRRRVFVTGLSAGGAMTAALLAAHPELFAGGAVIAGLPYGAASNVHEAFGAMFQGVDRPAADWGDAVRGASSHAGPWPKVSIWHGDDDSTVRPGNAEALARQWTDVHGLSETPSVEAGVEGHRRQVWLGPDGEPRVETYLVKGMGHGVPLAAGGREGWGAAGPFLLEVGLSSSLCVLRFWGLAPPADEAAATIPAVAGDAPQPQVQTLTWTPERPLADPAAVIDAALRAAGLIK